MKLIRYFCKTQRQCECTLSFQERNEIFTVAMPLKEIEINPVFIEEYHGDEV